jgi:hypothetical protein
MPPSQGKATFMQGDVNDRFPLRGSGYGIPRGSQGNRSEWSIADIMAERLWLEVLKTGLSKRSQMQPKRCTSDAMGMSPKSQSDGKRLRSIAALE